MDTSQGQILFDVRVLLEEIQYIYTHIQNMNIHIRKVMKFSVGHT